MGIISRMQGKSDGKIEVSITPEATGPGGEMAVRFSILEELDDKARTVFAGVTCTGRYKVTERERDSDGNVRTHTVWRSVDIYEHKQPMMLQHGPQEARFALPDEAQPASDDVVIWEAWARVDREKGIDVVETIPFDVRVPADRIPDTRTADATNDGLTITGIPAAAREGDTLRGTLTVNVTDGVKARAVSVRLHRRCTYVAEAINDYSLYRGDLVLSTFFWSNTSKITDDQQVAEVDVAGKTDFEPGQPQSFEWAIDVPDSGPTSSHQYAQVDWRIEAVLDRRMRGDKAVESPIIVV
jgi:hypothetical protein